MDKIEKQFFDTFGIEPFYKSESCDGWGRTVEVRYFTNKEDAKKFGIVLDDKPQYPPITDRILLELICLHNIYLWQVHTSTVNELKNVLLNRYIEYVNLMPDENEKQEYINEVQVLFKENN